MFVVTAVATNMFVFAFGPLTFGAIVVFTGVADPKGLIPCVYRAGVSQVAWTLKAAISQRGSSSFKASSFIIQANYQQ